MPPKTSRSGHETASMYSTRSSKRKNDDVAPATENDMSSKSSLNSSQEELDSDLPPAKRTRRSTTSSNDSPPVEPLNAIEIAEIPLLKVNSPSAASEEDPDQSRVASPSPSPVKPARGRGRGRGRARGTTRGGRGGRGGFAKGIPPNDYLNVKNGRGKAGRIKKSDNARIQALLYRKHAIRQQFKLVANIQREALAIVSEKALEKVAKEPTYHESLPEFGDTMGALKKKFDDVNEKMDREFAVNKAYLERQLAMNLDYENRRYESAADEIEEKAILELQHRTLHVFRQAETHGSLETTPIYRGIVGETIKEMENPYAIPEQIVGLGKPGTENERRRPGRKPKNASPIKKADEEEAPVRVKASLYRPIIQHAVAADLDDPSAVPTPAGGSEDDEETPDPGSDDVPRDKYGVYLPNKAPPRNGAAPQNKFMVKPSFEFEPEEIGVRLHHEKRNNRSDLFPIGIDANPTPKNFHFDQFARGHNSAHNKPEDLDPELVSKHKVHPVYGLPIQGSLNPDNEDLTDWSKPLPQPKPTVFYLINQAGAVVTYETSRSARMIETPKEFDEYVYPTEESDTRNRMRYALSRFYESETSVLPAAPIAAAPPPPPKSPPPPPKIDPALLKAVNEAPPPTTATTPRSRGYDPVRDMSFDSSYRTPYPSHPHQPSAVTVPANASGTVHHGACIENPINLLVNAAELRRSMPPPSHAPRPPRSDVPRPEIRRPWIHYPNLTMGSHHLQSHGMQQTSMQQLKAMHQPSMHQPSMHQPPTMQSQPGPPPSFFSNTQQQPIQYSPPRTNLPGGPLRQLQPAPPKPRNPQPQRPYYGGYQ